MATLPKSLRTKTKLSSQISLDWVPHISIMDRYISLEMIAPFLFGVGSFSSIALVIGSLFELVRLITDAGLGVLTAIQIFALQLPQFMMYSFPMSVLLGTLISYSRLSSDGETTALRSSGVSPYRLVVPAVVLSLLISGMTFLFSEVLVPSANWQAKTILRSALKQDNPQFKSKDIFYQQYGEVTQPNGAKEQSLIRSFYARRFDGRKMRGLTILDFSQGTLQQVLSAESARWLPDLNVWDLENGTTYLIGNDGSYRNILRFERQQLRLPRAPLDLANEQRNSAEMNITELSRYIELVRASGNYKEAKKLEVSLQQKYAFPFICVIFAMVGSPLGMRPQRTSAAKGFGLSILIIFGYYLLLFICGALGQVEILSAIAAAWLPNAIGLGAGLFLLSRVR
jgi:lipopolysaccharide export system permease protein